jgi:uncharacterized membrane protein (DUF2068 family)
MNHVEPHRESQTHSSAGLRAVAAIEATKGVLVLLLGLGVLSLIHKNLDDVAGRLTEILRINPEGKLSSVFLNLANHATDKTLWVVATGALIYATVRSIEAFGLWRGRDWAQWFALLSGALYLPGEIYSLLRHPSGLKWGALVTNAVVVTFMVILRVNATPRQRQ